MTSWLGGFNDKTCGVWEGATGGGCGGRSPHEQGDLWDAAPLTQIIFKIKIIAKLFCFDFDDFFFHMFQIILRKKILKKIVEIFCRNYFFHILRIFRNLFSLAKSEQN